LGVTDRDGIKPQWLADFHAFLRERPILRATLWSVVCFLLFQLDHLRRGDALTPARLVVDVIAWAGGGLLFFVFMRWWEARHAGR